MWGSLLAVKHQIYSFDLVLFVVLDRHFQDVLEFSFGRFEAFSVLDVDSEQFALNLLHSVLQSHQPEHFSLLQIDFPPRIRDCHYMLMIVFGHSLLDQLCLVI